MKSKTFFIISIFVLITLINYVSALNPYGDDGILQSKIIPSDYGSHELR